MKNKLSITGLAVLLIAILSFTAFQDKGKGQQNKNKSDDQKEKNNGNKGKGKRDVIVIRDNNNDRDNRDSDDGDDRGNNNNGNSNNGNRNSNNGNGQNKVKNRDIRNINDNEVNGWSKHVWNRDNFKERKKLRKQDKVTLCHKFNNANEAAVTINVSTNAADAHMKHGDVVGACPVVNDKRFSDGYWKRRTDYYNSLEDTREQVSYSQSILDYAVSRLTQSRTQLATMQTNNVPAADIQRKQVVVNELEQNVSVLETLVGVAAGLIAERL